LVHRPGDTDMPSPRRPVAFIVASTDHGMMIVNRNDYRMMASNQAYGVGFRLLTDSSYDSDEAEVVVALLNARRTHFGDGVKVLDIGANIGVFTVEWARHMTAWGEVMAFEAQERVFYALAGNITVNNCFNARAIWAAVTSQCGMMRVPVPNYLAPASFGSLELRPKENNEEIGQPVDYREDRMDTVTALSIDSLTLARLDLMKVDVEGMEIEVLEGARRTIDALHPILVVENIKSDLGELQKYLDRYGYRRFNLGLNTVAIHSADPTFRAIRDKRITKA